MRKTIFAMTSVSLLSLALLQLAAMAQQPIQAAKPNDQVAKTLALSQIAFVNNKVDKFGEFDVRPGATFKLSEPVLLYLEPVGFVISGEKSDRVDMTTDVKVVSLPDRHIVLEKKSVLSDRGDREKRIVHTFQNLSLRAPAPGQISRFVKTERQLDRAFGRVQPALFSSGFLEAQDLTRQQRWK